MNALAALPKSYRNEKDAARRRQYAISEDNKRRRRKSYQTNTPKVSTRKLEFYRENPQALLKLKKTVCLECGAKLDILKGKKGGHLHEVHKMTAEHYLTKWPGAPLVGRAFRNRKAHQGRKPKPTLRGHSRPNLKIRGHLNGRPLKKSDLLPLLAQGLSYVEIGKRVNRHFTTIEDAVRRWNLRGFVQSLKDVPDLKPFLVRASPETKTQPKEPLRPGRPRDPETDRRIDLAGRLLTEGHSQSSMRFDLFPAQAHTPQAAYVNTRRLFSDHREEIYRARDRHLAAKQGLLTDVS